MRVKHLLVLTALSASFLVATSSLVFATSLSDEAGQYLERFCIVETKGLNAVVCSFGQRITTLEEQSRRGHFLVDYAQVRGTFWETDSTPENVQTPDSVTVSCDRSCVLWVNYDVDTRNTTTEGAPPNGFNHLYHLYLDGVNQSMLNQASAPVANAAIPLALNGVFEVSAGEHTVDVYVRATGGHLEQHESHLQVLAFQ